MIREFLKHFSAAPVPLALALVTTSVCVVLGYMVWPRRKRWVKVGKVGKLYIFPLKSGAVKESSRLNFQSMGPRLVQSRVESIEVRCALGWAQ